MLLISDLNLEDIFSIQTDIPASHVQPDDKIKSTACPFSHTHAHMHDKSFIKRAEIQSNDT